MHRLVSFLLSAALLAALCVPAMGAAESADARLARVTQSVKDTLALDTEDYPEFRGDVYEQELGNIWNLNWSGNGSTLSVEALEDGTVVSYWRSDDADSSRWYGNALPTLPKVDANAAKKAAEAFLARVLDSKTESVKLGEPARASQLNSAACRFYGTILLNGLPSPLSYSITVRGSDNVVTSFRRDALANSYLGSVPSATPAVSKADAAATLKGTLRLELVYVADENDETRAVLRYVPKAGGEQYVDAQTGKLVAPGDEIFFGGAEAPTANEAEMDTGLTEKRALTEAELAGVEKLEGVLASGELDKRVRGESAYKLDGYALASANYRLVKDGETETVLCTIRYSAPEDADGFTASRTFTVDARTGAVKSLYSGAPWNKDKKSAVSAADAQKAADAFLARYSAHAAEFALYDTSDNTADGAPFYSFTYARKANGYFFPENACTVQIDRMTGAVAGLNYTYDEKIVFDAAEGLISESAALDAWMATYEVALGYRSMPKALDKANALEAKLIGMGYTRFRTLLLTYALEREDSFSGVDAKTGKAVAAPSYDSEIAYGDVAGHWAQEPIDRLAACGVGYACETFRPDEKLTQWALVALLASTQGMRVDVENASKEERDSAYECVYRMGALTRAERSDDAAIDRGTLVKVLLSAAGYAPIAKLPGIFTCRFADRAAIPEGDLGYAALAQGFGLVTNERYDASSIATRAVAAVMLVRLMEREG